MVTHRLTLNPVPVGKGIYGSRLITPAVEHDDEQGRVVVDVPAVWEALVGDMYETEELLWPGIEPSTYVSHADYSLADASTPGNDIAIDFQRFDPAGGGWLSCGGSGTYGGPPGGANELVRLTRLSAGEIHWRPGTDTATRQPRTIVFDLVQGKPVKLLVTMPRFFPVILSIESRPDARALAVSLVQDRDAQGRPQFSPDGKPICRPDDGGRLEIHRSIGIVDIVSSSDGDAAIFCTASCTIAAGNAASLAVSSNGNAATDHTIDYTTGGTNHGFSERVRSKYSDTPNAAGVAAIATVHNSAGTSGTQRCTRSGAANNGISFTIIEMTGVETAFTGHVAKGGSISGSATVDITVGDGSIVPAAAEDFNGGPLAFTAGLGETLDNTTPNTVSVICGQWHSTNPTAAGTYTSDAGGGATRVYRIAAAEMVAVVIPPVFATAYSIPNPKMDVALSNIQRGSK